MNTLSLRIRYRPLRIGWCLQHGDLASFRKAIRLNHALWGGRFNPIISVGAPEIGKQIVRAFHLDLLIPLSGDVEVKTFVDQFPYLPSPFFPPDIFIKERSGRVYSQSLDLYHPIRRLYEKHLKNNPSPAFHASIFEWDDDDPLADVCLATFGGFLPKEDTGLDYSNLIEKHLAAELVSLGGRAVLPSDSYKKATPNWISSLDLERRYSISYRTPSPGFYLGNSADFEDLITYWNLRATDSDILFYDPRFPDRLNPLRAEYLNALATHRKGPAGFDDYISVWCHREDDVDLSGFGDKPRRVLARPDWNAPAPIMYFEEKAALAAIGESFGQIRVSFSLPQMPGFNERHSWSQNLVASISAWTGLYGNERLTLKTPFLPELNEYYGRNLYFEWNKARVEPDGIGIIVHLRRDDLTLSALDVSSLISKIFQIAGVRARLSKAGLVSSQLIQQLGGLQGCRVFKIAGVRDLIEKYSPDQSFTRSGANQVIGRIDPRTGKPNFSEYHYLFLEARQLSAKLSPEDAFRYLIKHGVFRVGLKFGCPNCRLEFWVSLDDVKTFTRCEYCGHDFNVTPQLRDRDWHFRRSGLFGKENHQEGGIPVALVLQQMDTVFSHPDIFYTTGMDLEPEGAGIQKCETDFVLVKMESMEDRVQIAIGECKTRKEITEEDVLKLRLVAEALEKVGIRAFLIFAKLGDFTPDELSRCQAANSGYRMRLILLGSSGNSVGQKSATHRNRAPTGPARGLSLGPFAGRVGARWSAED